MQSERTTVSQAVARDTRREDMRRAAMAPSSHRASAWRRSWLRLCRGAGGAGRGGAEAGRGERLSCCRRSLTGRLGHDTPTNKAGGKEGRGERHHTMLASSISFVLLIVIAPSLGSVVYARKLASNVANVRGSPGGISMDECIYLSSA